MIIMAYKAVSDICKGVPLRMTRGGSCRGRTWPATIPLHRHSVRTALGLSWLAIPKGVLFGAIWGYPGHLSEPPLIIPFHM